MHTHDHGGPLKRADPSTFQDKVLVGYQGWFTCAGDGEPIHPGHHGWLHWFHNPLPSGGRPNTDLWPDLSEYDPAELFVAPGLETSSGGPVHLFSSRNAKTVQRHFHWMALHGIDGAFLQRFAGQCEIKSGNMGVRNLRDEVGERVREAAEAQGRVFAIMYDVSGVAPDKIQNILEQDWAHLLRDQHILDSPSYLRENGRPVVALWGFGLDGRNHTPELVRAITESFRSSTPGGVYLVAGTAGHWRTANSDADRNPGFVKVWTDCFDAISPWTVGRYKNEEGADRWGEQRVKADAEYLKKIEAEGGRKVDYMPVVLPGGSGFNLSEGKWGMNDMPRNGGRFLWRQIYNARRAGVRTIYGAMWDEYDEGTAFMPVVSYSSQLPVHPTYRFVALDVDGHNLPPDWYMRIVGYAAESFHGERTLSETLPVKELQDYWSTRPHLEPVRDAAVDDVTRVFSEWQTSGTANLPSDAPPPYSLEDTSPVPPPLPPKNGGRPAVPVDSRPLVVGAAGVAAVAVGNALGTSRHGRDPPPVDLTTRPLAASPPTSARLMGLPPPVPARLIPGPGHVSPSSSLGHVPATGGRPSPVPRPDAAVGFPVPNAVGFVGMDERGRLGSRHERVHEHGRYEHGHTHGYGHGHHHRRSRSHSRSRSRSRSRSSSSGSRKRRRSPALDAHAHAHAHAHTHSHSAHPAYSYPVPLGPPPSAPGGYAPPMGPPPGHGHVHGQPSYPYGMNYTHSESSMHGPVGYPHAHHHAHAQGSYQGAYAPDAQGYGYNAPGYGTGYPGQQYGYGYDSAAQPSPSPYYASYAPGSGGGGGGNVGSGIAGGKPGIMSKIENVAGKSTIGQTLEKLTHSGGSLFNKFK